jgi:hypothetical protein
MCNVFQLNDQLAGNDISRTILGCCPKCHQQYKETQNACPQLIHWQHVFLLFLNAVKIGKLKIPQQTTSFSDKCDDLD